MLRRFNTLFYCMLLTLMFAASCAACGSEVRDGRWAVPVRAEGLPNLFRVTPDLYRSAQPEGNGMRSAEELGIRTVLSLRTSNKDPELAEGTGLRLERVPVNTWDIDDEEITEALRVIGAAPKPVLVHCYHGADRTGLTVAMYRIVFQGWSKEDAKDELVNGGYGFHSIWINIPRYIDKADIEAIRAQVLGHAIARQRRPLTKRDSQGAKLLDEAAKRVGLAKLPAQLTNVRWPSAYERGLGQRPGVAP